MKKLDAGGPITADALKDGDVDVALLFSGSSVIPKNAVILADDKGLQGADNPFVLIRKDKATPKVLKTINARVEEAHDEGVQRDGVAANVNKADPADAAEQFLEDSNIKH